MKAGRREEAGWRGPEPKTHTGRGVINQTMWAVTSEEKGMMTSIKKVDTWQDPALLFTRNALNRQTERERLSAGRPMPALSIRDSSYSDFVSDASRLPWRPGHKLLERGWTGW